MSVPGNSLRASTDFLRVLTRELGFELAWPNPRVTAR